MRSSATTTASDVAEVGRAAADRDHDRPVLVDDADPQLAGDVGGGEHGLHAGVGEGAAGVDGEDVGPGVVGELERGVEHAVDPDVVDVAAVAEGELVGLVLHPGGADAALGEGHGHLVGDERLDGVEDLHVPGAAAQVGAEVAGRLVAGERALGGGLVEQGLGAHEDARGAEAALQGAGGGEGVGEAVALVVAEPLEGGDRPARDPLEAGLARDLGLAVDEHGAATALARRRAAVLRRGQVELVAQGREEVGMVPADRHLLPVDGEGDGCGLGESRGECVGGAGHAGHGPVAFNKMSISSAPLHAAFTGHRRGPPE